MKTLFNRYFEITCALLGKLKANKCLCELIGCVLFAILLILCFGIYLCIDAMYFGG